MLTDLCIVFSVQLIVNFEPPCLLDCDWYLEKNCAQVSLSLILTLKKDPMRRIPIAFDVVDDPNGNLAIGQIA